MTRPIKSSASVDGHSPADVLLWVLYTITSTQYSGNTQCMVNDACLEQLFCYVVDLSILLLLTFLYPLRLFSLTLSYLSLILLLTLPPSKESFRLISYLPPLNCHPPSPTFNQPHLFYSCLKSTQSFLLHFISGNRKNWYGSHYLLLVNRVGSMLTEGWLMRWREFTRLKVLRVSAVDSCQLCSEMLHFLAST